MVKMHHQKIWGIEPSKLTKKELNLSFWGYADRYEKELELDSDDTDYEPFSYFDYLTTTPLNELIVISR